MYWWLGITAIVAGALGYGYWEHTRESRRLTAIFTCLSEKFQGRVKSSSLLTLPQLHFELDGRKLLITAMPTSGHDAAGTTGYTSPFTFVNLELEFDSAQKIQIVRSISIVDQITATLSRKQCTVGEEAFDTAFRLRSDDCEFAIKLLDGAARHKLLKSQLPSLDIRVEGRKISVHMNGYAQTQSEIEDLIEISKLIAERCSARQGA